MCSCALLIAMNGSARADSSLKLVPPDAFAFSHLKVAELWKSDSMKDFRDVLQKAGPQAIQAFDKRFLPTPSTLSEFTLIVLAKPQPNGMPGMFPVFVVKTSEPIAREKFIATALPNAKVRKIAKSNVYVGENSETGITFLEDDTFMFGPVEGIEEYLTREVTKSGPMSPAIKLAATRPMVMAFNPSLLPAQAKNELPPPFHPFLKANLVTFSIELKKDAVVDFRMNFADVSTAQEAEKSMKMFVTMGRQALDQAKGELMRQVVGDPERKTPSSFDELPQAAASLFGLGMIGYYDELLKTLPILRDGSVIAMTIRVPEGPYTSMVAISGIGMGLMLPAVQKVREAAGRAKDSNNLKQIGLAMHNYDDTYNGLPPAAICDKKGKALLSWRVAILPYIEQDVLYKEFKLDEPWDSEHNIKLLDRIPQIYVCPGIQQPNDNKTFYRVALGNPAKKGDPAAHTMFDPIKTRRFGEITDGLSNTLMVVTAAESVPWTKPDELMCEPGKPLPKLAEFFSGGSNVLFGDGSVRFIRMPLAEDKFRALLSCDGGEVINLD